MLHCVIAYPKDSILGQRLGNSLNMPYFSWPDCRSMQMFSLIVYFVVTYTVTEARAKGFKAKMLSD